MKGGKKDHTPSCALTASLALGNPFTDPESMDRKICKGKIDALIMNGIIGLKKEFSSFCHSTLPTPSPPKKKRAKKMELFT